MDFFGTAEQYTRFFNEICQNKAYKFHRDSPKYMNIDYIDMIDVITKIGNFQLLDTSYNIRIKWILFNYKKGNLIYIIHKDGAYYWKECDNLKIIKVYE
jgi:hypothetical protein